MEANALTFVVLALQAALLVMVALVWRAVCAVAPSGERQLATRVVGALVGLEKRLRGHLSLVHSQVLELASVSAPQPGGTEPAGPPVAVPPPETAAGPPDPAADPASAPTLQAVMPVFWGTRTEGAGKLVGLLNEAEFRESVWLRMAGPFDQAASEVVDYLRGQGLPEPILSPHPPVAPQDFNHWRFMVVSGAGGDLEARRVLIPRYFDRYDTAVHGHLFTLFGDPAGDRRNLRALRRCAALSEHGDLGTFIESRLVLEKGIVVV